MRTGMRAMRRFTRSIACACGLLVASAAVASAQQDSRAESIRLLQDIVDELRAAERLTGTELAARAGAAFPRDGMTPEDLATLLAASFLVEGLDTRSYHEPGASGGFTAPEDVATAAKVYHIDLFNAILGRRRLVAARDPNGRTALMYAAEGDHFEALRTLLPMSGDAPFTSLYPDRDEEGRPYIDWCDKDGYTALMYASAANSRVAVNYLINAGADVEPQCRVARFSALQLAQNAGHDGVVRAIEARLSAKSALASLFESPIMSLAAGFVLGGSVSVPAIILLVRRWRAHYRERLAQIERRSAQPWEAG